MNKRQNELLGILYDREEYITYAELAEKLGVSVKTVRNDLAEIKTFLSEDNLGQVISHPRVGIKLISDDTSASLLEFKPSSEEKEIMFFIIGYLFKKEILTAQRLTEQYYIGRNSLDKILNKISKWFCENNIVFERRRGKGISIRYSEFNYRIGYMNFYSDYADMFYDTIAKTERLSYIGDMNSAALREALDGFDTETVIKIIAEIQRHFGIKFKYMSETNLLVLLSLCITRTRKGKKITMSDTANCEMNSGTDKIISNNLCEKLESTFKITFSKDEKKFLEFAVAICEIQDFDSTKSRRNFEMENVFLCRFTVRAIRLLSDAACVELTDDDFFVHQMNLLLKATSARLKYGIVLKNKLLPQIKEYYPNMLALAWFVGSMFEKELGLEINEHEVGYLALHIGGAIERRLLTVSACVVCNYGIGVSQILKEKLTRAIPELRITSVFSGKDILKIKNEECDLIISTTTVDIYDLDRETIEVGHFLSDKDIKSLKDRVRTIALKKKKELRRLMPSKKIFNKKLIFPKCEINNKDDLLHMLCSKLEVLGYVTPEFEKTVFEREAATSTDIGKGFAIPHGLSRHVNRSTVAFASTVRPITWTANGEKADLIFLLSFDLDKDENTKDEIIRFYRSIVECMENDAECKKLRSAEDADVILNILNLW